MEEKKDKIITIRVGKYGLTPEVIDEIRTILKKYKVAKVKLLKTSLDAKDKNEVTAELKRRCKARHAKLLGHIVTLNE